MKRFLLCLAVLLAAGSLARSQPKPVHPGYQVVTKSIPNRDVRKTKILRGVQAPDGSMAIDYDIYSYIKPYAGTLFIVGKGLQKNQFILPETYGIYDAAARRELHPCTAKDLKVYSDCVTEIREASGDLILVDREARVIGGQRYKFVMMDPRQPLSRVSVGGQVSRYGFIDSCGNPLTPLHYSRAGYVKDGFVPVCRDGKYTFLDSTGREVIAPKYAYLTDFSNGVAAFSTQGSFDTRGDFNGRDWGFINSRGEELGAARYEQIAKPGSFALNGGKVDVKLDGKWVSVNPLALTTDGGALAVSGARWVAFQEQAANRNDQKKQPWGFRIAGGEIMLKPKWDIAGDLVDGRAIVGRIAQWLDPNSAIKQQEYLWGVIDEAGREVIPLSFRNIRVLERGLFAFAQGEGRWFEERWRYGVMDRDGKILLPATYTRFGELSEGMIAVRKDGADGYINLKGEEVIPARFARAFDFKNGYAVVTRNEKEWFWITPSGQPLLPDKTFLGVSNFHEGKADVWTTIDAWGRSDGRLTIDPTGKVLVTHPRNPPPAAHEARCPKCDGSGGRFADFDRTYTTTEVDNFNANAPGAKLIITKTRFYTETKRVGECWSCNGKGTVMREATPR